MLLREIIQKSVDEGRIVEGVGWGIEPPKQKRRWSVPFDLGSNTKPLEEKKEEKTKEKNPLDKEIPEPKILYKNEWVSMMTTLAPDGTDYIYSHETRCEGNIVAVLLYERKGVDGWYYGLRDEVTPSWGTESQLSALTGGVEGETPIKAAIKEVREEAGYICKEEDFKPLGTVRGSKSTDTIYTLYALDVSGLKKTKPTGKDVGEIVWLGGVEAKKRCVDAIWFAMYARFGSW